MRPENRARFKADERAYLDEWPLTATGKIQRHVLSAQARELAQAAGPREGSTT